MNVAVRVNRILAQMENYQKKSPTDEWPSKLAEGRLGEPIGCYRNPGSEGPVIGIFADGMAWRECGRPIEIRYTDLVRVELASEKKSEGLLLFLRDGKEQQLPVKGHRGRFMDSMEMLRFVDRVMRDLSSQAENRAEPDIIISVRFLTTFEGGRATPVLGEFYTCPLFIDGEGFDCRLLLEDQVLDLGVIYEVPVRFLYRDKAMPKMKLGAQIHLWEGGNVAEGKIIQVFESGSRHPHSERSGGPDEVRDAG